MRPLKIKDRCTKKKLKKCEEVARTYDKIQTAYAYVKAVHYIRDCNYMDDYQKEMLMKTLHFVQKIKILN